MKTILSKFLQKGPSSSTAFLDPEQSRFGPHWSNQGRPIAIGESTGRLHLKDTLQSGRPHFRHPVNTLAPTYHLLFDASPSILLGWPWQEIQPFLHFFRQWQDRHRLRGLALAHREYTWGPELWKKWQDTLARQPSGVVFLFSDFHGPLPSGPFWSSSTSRHELKVCRLIQPLPNFKKRELFADVRNKHSGLPISSRHVYDPAAFEKAKSNWEKQLEHFFRKSGVPCHTVEGGQSLDLAKAFHQIV